MIMYATDLEGPIAKNDNAAEFAEHLLGPNFFPIVSKYDDCVADVEQRPGYNAGDTLRLIAPFLRAYGATNRQMQEYAKGNILLVPGAKETIQHIQSIVDPFFIISTSFRPYVEALCELTGFNTDNIYCTDINLDKYSVIGSERRVLEILAGEISAMTMPEWSSEATSLGDLDHNHAETIRRLDYIFSEVISNMRLGRLLEVIKPVGGAEKAAALGDCLRRAGVSDGCVYTGDSITDVQALRAAKAAGGLAVSFNGNGYSVKDSDIAVMSPHTLPSSIIADALLRRGREEVISLASRWDEALTSRNMADLGVPTVLAEGLYEIDPAPRVILLDDDNRSRIAEESSAFRKTVRGTKAGGLG